MLNRVLHHKQNSGCPVASKTGTLLLARWWENWSCTFLLGWLREPGWSPRRSEREKPAVQRVTRDGDRLHFHDSWFPSKRWECALLRSHAAQPIAWVWGVATMCLFTDNTSCSFIQTQNQKALVHLVQSTRAHRDHWQKRCLCIYQPDAPRYDEKTRDAKTCADVLLGNTPFICKSQDWTIQHCVLH